MREREVRRGALLSESREKKSKDDRTGLFRGGGEGEKAPGRVIRLKVSERQKDRTGIGGLGTSTLEDSLEGS